MPNIPNLMYVHPYTPLSRTHFETLFQGGDPERVALMSQLLLASYASERHDFNTAIETAHWTVAKTSVGGEVNFAYNAQRNGALRGATGATGDNVVALHKAQTYLDAADHPVFMGRLKMPSSLADTVIEIGLSDPKSSEFAVSVTDIDTPAIGNGVTDGAFIAMDTAQDLTTMAIVGVGASTSVAKTLIDTHTPTASLWWEFVIGVRAGQSMCAIWDSSGEFIAHTVVNSGPDVGVLMRPSILVKALAASSRVLDIDWLAIIAERNAVT